MDRSIPLLTKIIADLKAAISTVSGKVYTRVPDREEFPYLVISCQANPDYTLGKSEFSYEMRIRCFSNKPDPGESLNIRAQIIDLLNHQDILLTDNSLLGGTIQRIESFLEPDHEAWQAFVDFQIDVLGVVG